jgi:cytoskeletal protein RodZ
MVLTGHLDDQSLPDLIRTLRVQRKSGRLQVEYTDTPGSFFFEDGQLVDARLGSLRGLEALYAALALDGASFNFNPLVRPPERSIDRQQQKFITDLVEIPRRENLAEIKVAGGAFPNAAARVHSAQPAPLQLAPVSAELIAPLEERLTAVEAAVNATSRRFSRERLVYAVVISFLVGLTLVTALQALIDLRPPPASARGATGGEAARTAASATTVKRGDEGVALAGRAGVANASQAASATKNESPAPVATSPVATPDATQIASSDARARNGGTANARGYDVRVLLEVRDGQVTNARVLNPRPGAKAYEALALKTARQRRYPKNFTGGDTWKVRVKP